MQEQFNVIQNLLKEQFGKDSFEEFGNPTEDCILVAGRIINISNEDTGLKELEIGILNADNSTGVYKMKMNLQTVPQFTLFEGEIIVAQGFQGHNNVLNVNNIFKPKS